MGAAPSPADTRSRRLLWGIMSAIGGLLLVALVIVLVVWRGGAGTPSADTAPTSTRPTPSASAEPIALPTVAPVSGPRPTECNAIYSPDMLATLNETSTLNPDWVAEDTSATFVGATDPELITVVEGLNHLTCVWGDEAGASDVGLVTNVVFVTAEQSEAAHQSLLALGQNCYDELGGIRCVIEDPNADEGIAGESHFLRDGIWLATHYVNAGPDGYTHDMIATIWAGA